ncbi:hypothetical protein N7520_002892 [Penicillium odoratum]|uniref:uncharacterized protein n=1 Tax=Penicillium odoratum TaxID=1167516 RepID=UPI00254844B1|nr:uncharacterized protein N7520_002892 [Penicillium odoratum]KAJ5772363.1 hypothetical protein N7520_002892 [Penicillium odoratum]
MSVPLLDVTKFTSGTPAERGQFCQALVASFQRYGFVRPVNHSILEHVIVDMFTRSTNFFQLSPARKMAMAHPRDPKPQRGWSRVGEKRTAKLFRHGASGCDDMIDAREHFDQGSPLDQEWPNLYPSEDDVPGFRTTMETFYSSSHAVAQILILPALEEGLGLESGVLTGVGGLEARDYETGDWVPLATGSIFEMIVNISETLERWTNGQVRAGVHQVTVLPALQGELEDEKLVPERFSTAFFLKTDRNACVGALRSFVSEQCPEPSCPQTSADTAPTRRIYCNIIDL